MNLSPTTDLLFSHKNRIHYRQENKIFSKETLSL
jgi:hypothetical protein